MDTTKPPASSEVGHTADRARGDTWTASQLRIESPSEIGAGRPLGVLRWWPVAALLLAFFYVILGISVLSEPVEQHPDNDLWAILMLASAALLVAGMVIRRSSFSLGTTLIILGCPVSIIPSWLIFPPLMGLFVFSGAIQRDTRVIDKRVLLGVLITLVTAIYVGVAVGVGTLIGFRDERNLLLAIWATAIVAVLFQPIRARLQRFANRLVYGKRATPYEVLAHFADRVAGTYATEDVLSKMARALEEGTGAKRAEVWLRSGDKLRLAASSPDDRSADPSSVTLAGNGLPDFAGVDRAIEVQHQGELLGALTLTKPSGEPMRAVEDELLQDLASQAGLVMRNVGLNQEVLARLEELKASRQRLVAAQDEARRRLERNLHDGAQQHLVALKVQLSLVERVADNDKVKRMLKKVASDADDALEALRDLARGIYPPLLADQGLAAALEAQAQKAPIPVHVHADNVSRHSEDEEAAVYFCCLEALQNAAKHAQASTAEIDLVEEEDVLAFSVRDNGRGFDLATTPQGDGLLNMADRLEAMGGTLEVRSSHEDGTSVTGQLPLQPLTTHQGSH